MKKIICFTNLILVLLILCGCVGHSGGDGSSAATATPDGSVTSVPTEEEHSGGNTYIPDGTFDNLQTPTNEPVQTDGVETAPVESGGPGVTESGDIPQKTPTLSPTSDTGDKATPVPTPEITDTGSHNTSTPVVGTATPGFTEKPSNTESSEPTATVPAPTGEPTAVPPLEDFVITFKDPFLLKAVRQQLGKAASEPVYYSEAVGVKSLQLRVKGILRVDDLKYFESLEILNLYGNKISDLTPLASLKNLKTLNVSKNSVKSLEPLRELVNLEKLTADENGISDLTPLLSLVNLKYISVKENQIKSLDGLENMSKLEELYASQNRITDTKALKGCFALKTLKLASNGYYDILEDGTIVEMYLTDISFAENLTYLESLDISFNAVISLEALKGNTSLKILEATNNILLDIEPLRHSSIVELKVMYNQIGSFDPIRDMAFLNVLEYQNNPIEDTDALNEFLGIAPPTDVPTDEPTETAPDTEEPPATGAPTDTTEGPSQTSEPGEALEGTGTESPGGGN